MTAMLQSALDPAGPQAARLSHLWWLMFWISTAVFVIVLGFLAAAVARGRRARTAAGSPPSAAAIPSRNPPSEDDPRLTRAVAIAVGLTMATLFVLLVASVSTGRAIAAFGTASAVTIDITGHQYWWEIEYDDAVPSRRVLTANEIHIPVGRPVVLKVTSRDVIHSFWVPNLHGKRDLIPGIMSAIWLQADEPGVYRGQCAEFCGRQHAHMAVDVVAESESQFAGWLDAQRQAAPAPASAEAAHGRDVFMNAQCMLCHTVRGTPAHGQVGPDLTHVGARGKIASGTLPNNPSDMARWVRDPQHIKPGNQMPPSKIADADLQALALYLESLK
jgi:cytochrome c oxidase subunit 2